MRTLPFTAFALLFSLPCFAWGPSGHQIVAERAESELTPTAKQAVQKLLKGEPNPTLAGVANWADKTKNKKTAAWHFVNFPHNDCDYVPKRDCRGGKCVVAEIDRFEKVLANPQASHKDQQKALKYLVHFVGDIHQPLHAGYADDKGGNKFQVRYEGKGTNLHTMWDSLLVHDLTLPTKSDAKPEMSPVKWAEESCSIVHSQVYPISHKQSDKYVRQARSIIEQRLALAGDRLAAVLNRALNK